MALGFEHHVSDSILEPTIKVSIEYVNVFIHLLPSPLLHTSFSFPSSLMVVAADPSSSIGMAYNNKNTNFSLSSNTYPLTGLHIT